MTDEIPDIQVGQHALRTFKVNFRKKELVSITQAGSHWKGGVCTAVCLENRFHPVPGEFCGCGVYGTLSLAALRQFGRVYMQDIVTVIAAEGRTIIGSVGLRTAHARVIAYWAPTRGIRQIAAKQFEGARYYSDLQAMLDAHDLPAAGPLPKRRRFDSGVLAGILCAFWSLFAVLDTLSLLDYLHKHSYGWATWEAIIVVAMLFLATFNYKRVRQRFG